MKVFNFIKLSILLLIMGFMVSCEQKTEDSTARSTSLASLLQSSSAASAAASAATGSVPTSVQDVTTLDPEAQSKLSYLGTITSVDMSSGTPVVNFKVIDASGNGLRGLGVKNAAGTQLNNFNFVVAKLMPAVAGSPSYWLNYIVTSIPSASTTTAPCTTANTACGTRPSTDREGTLVDNGNGTYKYTFARNIQNAKATIDAMPADAGNYRKADLGDLTYDASLTHRLIVQYGGNIKNTAPAVAIKTPMTAVYDFIPATGAVVTATDTQRNIVSTEACNSCHGKIGTTTPHNGRADTRYCVTCHNTQRAFGRATSTSSSGAFTGNTYVADGEVLGDFGVMIHKIHKGSNIAGTSLSKTGYNYAGFALETLKGFPQSPNTCRKCHQSTTDSAALGTAQGDNWNTNPNRKACGSCHDNINWSTGATYVTGKNAHNGGAQTSDSTCVTCHTADTIKSKHMTENKTTFNPSVATGLTNFAYEVSSATVDGTSNDLTIKFKITADGTAITLASPAAGTVVPLAGYTGSPSFLLAYSLSGTNQSDSKNVDYNNFGRAAAQPASVSIATLLSTDNAATGSISGPDGSGYYTATILSASAFPAGSKMKTVALQGYFTQAAGTGGIAANTARHTLSSVKTVTGDTARRQVVDPAKCGTCHEWFEGHGGNRVVGIGTSGEMVCQLCHVPNLTSSGRGISDTNIDAWQAGTTPFSATSLSATDSANLTSWGWVNTGTEKALKFPEASNNFKDMIHGIHAGKAKTQALRFVRDRASSGTIMIFDTHEITYPNEVKNCESCHITKTSGTPTYSVQAIPAGALPTTTVVAGSDAAITTTALYKAARLGTALPNATDLVSLPVTAACNSCHDSALAVAHMNSNSGSINTSNALPAAGVITGGAGNYQGTVTRSTATNAAYPIEQCATCHGDGRAADVAKAHNK